MQQLSVNSAVVCLLFTGLLLYLCAPLILIMTAPDTAVAEECIRQSSHTLQGIIIREETPISTSAFGSVPVIADGQAVPAGATVAVRGNECILAPFAGIYIRETDGLEYLTADTLSEITPADVDKLRQVRPLKVSDSGKIVSGNGWLLAVAADTETVSLLQEGHSVTLTVQADDPFELTAVVTQISPAENGRCAVVFRCIDHLQHTSHLRYLTVSLHRPDTQALRIPAQAVQTDEAGSFVYRISASMAEKTYVNILSEEDGFILVSKDSSAHALHAGDTMIISPSNIKDGQQIH